MAEGKTEKVINSNKSSTKKRLEKVEKAVHEGIRGLAMDLQGMAENQAMMASAMEDTDEVVAALRALIVEKGVASDEGIEAKIEEIKAIKARVRQLRTKQQELRKTDADAARLMDSVSDPASGKVPTEAFIFGG